MHLYSLPFKMAYHFCRQFILGKAIQLKTVALCCALLLCAVCASAFGVIESFSPVSAPVGNTVTIVGYGFSSTAANNTVYFGAVKAKVISATSAELKVSVPAGATHRPLSVTVAGLTSYSRLPFVPTFENTGSAASYISFLPKEVLLQTNKPFSITSADFDGDGRPDLAVADDITANNYTVSLSVYKNSTAEGNISFSDKVFITNGITANSNNADLICVADIDGDGKLDLAVSKNGNIVWVYRNTSTAGNISFDEGHPFEVQLGLYQTGVINFGDLNFDGKPDLMTGSGKNNLFSILVNNSTPGTISFQDNVVFNITSWGISNTDVFEVTAADFTGDGKADLILSTQDYIPTQSYRGKAKIIILSNTSTAEGLSFSLESFRLLPSFLVYKLTVADFNNDGKVDILCKFRDEDFFHVFKNTSTYPTTSYDVLDFPAPYETINVAAADMDGDGKPDIVLNKTGYVSVYKNLSAAGSVAFEEAIDIKSSGVKYFSLSDIDIDGKPDIICVNTDENNFSLLKYSGNWSGSKNICPNGSVNLISYKKGGSYQWQLSTDSGATFTDVTNNNYYGGATTEKLLLNAVPSSFYGYQYRCVVDGASNNEVYEIKFANIWTGAYDNDWGNTANWSCGALPDVNTDVEVGYGEVMLNGDYSCRSLIVKSGATVKVGAGYKLTITH